MQASNHRFEGASAPDQTTTILLAYRDADHERLGRKYCNLVSDHFGLREHLDVSEWKFEMLDRCGMDRLAADDANRARLIVITTSCGDFLPDSMKHAVQSWCERPRQGHAALVVLLSECPGCSEAHWPDYDFVEHETRRCGMELVVYASGLTPENGSAFHLPEARRVTRNGLATVEDFAESSAME